RWLPWRLAGHGIIETEPPFRDDPARVFNGAMNITREEGMHAEHESGFDVTGQIVAFKRSMAPRREALRRAFGEVKDHVSRAADAVRKDTAAGRPVVPEVDYRDIRSGSVSGGPRQAIRRAGSAVARGVFPAPAPRD